jgi:uncharacterized membrane protein
MSAVAPSPPAHRRITRPLTRLRAIPHAETVLGLALLVVASVWLRTQAISAKFWIDEGLSVGIAHHDLFDIPGVLRQDGSPPLYYMLLHLWMAVVGGDGESRTHGLSVIFAVLTIPTGWWTARRIFGERSAWATAALAATLPFLTYYAQETRMYALVALLSLLTSGAFALAYAVRERWAVALFAASCVLLIYAHNWGLFLGAGLAVAFVVLWRTAPDEERPPLLRDGLLGFGAVAALYLPWVPSLLAQASETGAPWAERPRFESILNGLENISGGTETALFLGVLAVAGLLTLREGHEGSPRARAALGLGAAFVAAVLLAWVASQASPAWAARYFAAFVGPGLLLAGAGLVRLGRLGLVGLAIVLVLWFDPHDRSIRGKSDAYRVTGTLKEQGLVAPDDVVLSVHPEQGPLMRYYLGPGYRFADALGPVPDPQIFDWRDALQRLRDSGPVRELRAIAPGVQPGQRLVLILPVIRSGRWGAPWTSLVRRRSAQWERALERDDRFQRVAPVPKFGRRPLPRGVRAVVYLRLDRPAATSQTAAAAP